MNWFQKWFGKKTVVKQKPKVEVPMVPRMTLEDWQKFPENVSDFNALHKSPEFQKMLAVLFTIRPRGGIKGQSAEYSLGYIAGYEAAMTSIWVLTQHPKSHEDQIESTFGAEE